MTRIYLSMRNSRRVTGPRKEKKKREYTRLCASLIAEKESRMYRLYTHPRSPKIALYYSNSAERKKRKKSRQLFPFDQLTDIR